MSSDTPQRLGDYEILKVLGAGGMGRVYQVRNVITDRVEAMKVLLPEIGGREEVAARFLREIKVLAALNHPHIATLHTALTIDDQLLMIMEYVEGQPISALLANGPIAAPQALTYVEQILEALSYAHQQRVIHRDIKPANMMLTPSGTVKLMDFGIARSDDEATLLTAPGSTLGSMNYMSPEQVKGERTDERSDLYSLGISLYEMVTGDRPFHGDSSYSLMAAQVSQTPTPPIELQPNMPRGLNDIILTAIAKAPAERFQSADAFRNAVRSVLRELQEDKTMVQGSLDATVTGVRTPLPPARTGPITRPKTPVPGAIPAAPTPPPTASRVTAVPAFAATAAAPAAAPAPVPAPTTSTGHRGLYISLGALIVLVALVAAGLYIPKSRKAAADATGVVSTAPPAAITQPVATPTPAPQASVPAPAPAAGPSTPAEAAPTAAGLPAKKLTESASNRAAQVSAANAQAAAAAQAAAKLRAELDQLEHEIDQLGGRAAAVNSSLENLQRRQAASGWGLRGDMVSKQASMNANLNKAQDAVNRNDVERARRYAALAAADTEALEKFLGR